ncbi:MAG: hypothetical protein KQI62_20455 [Deltaproteobacteria bacterium]|nr:hypothetical protein [Deltaproteobacteria bacterium]
MAAATKEPSCATCPMKRYAEKKPNSLWAKLWRWHTGWCPGYKRYQAWLAERH